MKLRYQMRGLGIGIMVTALLMGVAGGEKIPLSDAEIKAMALELGMVESDSLRLSDIPDASAAVLLIQCNCNVTPMAVSPVSASAHKRTISDMFPVNCRNKHQLPVRIYDSLNEALFFLKRERNLLRFSD